MAEETTTEPVVSEPIAESTPVQPEPTVITPPASEPTPEAVITPTESTTPEPEVNTNGSNGKNGNNEVEPEQIPTAQPVEPLSPEPAQAPETAPELLSEPVQEPAVETPPAIPSPEPELVPQPESSAIPEPVPAPEPQVITSTFPISRARELLIKAREMIQFRKRKKLEKIMSLFLKQSSITNDDVQKHVYVSDATATRYLQQLEKEGRIKKKNAGKYLSYSRM